ncbi:MAG: N-6 DNA methylase [Candidatus Cloacimonetes bacterium]|nr:N-6 DNA methylase [Candidatus Cloacimonadota bacterium]
MLDKETKKKIDDARDILVGKVPVPSSQVEQITVALIYKFMYDMDSESVEMGGNPQYFTGEYAKYAWNKLFAPELSGEGRVILYQEALGKIPTNTEIPTLFRDIFKNAFLPYRDPATLRLFLSAINEFTYDHSEKLGDAFEYLLAILGSQGDAGQFRTPRHIIDFIVALVDPQKDDSILDPACGTAGFLISAYKHILKNNSANYNPQKEPHSFAISGKDLDELVINGKNYRGEKMNPNQREYLHQNIVGYDIAFEMVRLSLVNMYLHGFSTPKIHEYDTLTRDDRWSEHASVILANPPFMTPKGGIVPHNRFTIKSKRSEVLFVDYILEHLTANGKAGVIVPEGIIFQSGKAYKELRKTLVEGNYLVGVISLPNGVFNPYSGVKTSILWLDKSIARKTDKIIFCKVNNDGYNLGAQRKAIAENDLPDIFAIAQAYKKAVQRNEDFTCKDERISLVEKSRLAESGDYNLSAGRYEEKGKNSTVFEMVNLGEVAEIVSGGTPDTKNESFWNGEIDWVTLVDLPATEYVSEINSTERQITKEGLKSSSAKLLPVNTVLVSSRASIGRVAINIKPVATNQGFKNLIVKNPEILNYRYLAYMMRGMKRLLESLGTGGTYKEVSKTSFESIKIPLPPLSAQEEIVAELDSYQKIIDGARMVIDNWKPKIEIDPKWEIVKLGDIVEFNPMFKALEMIEDETVVGFLPMTDLEINCIYATPQNTITIGDVKRKGYTQFTNEDVLLAKITPCFENGKIGIIKNLTNNMGFGSTEYHVLRCRDVVLPEIIYLYLSSVDFHKHTTPLMTGSAGQKRVPKEIVKDYKIYLPPMNEQKKIVAGLIKELDSIMTIKEIEKTYKQKINDKMEKMWT